MSLEKFAKKQSPGWPAVTIRKNASICINRKAVQEFKLEERRKATGSVPDILQG